MDLEELRPENEPTASAPPARAHPLPRAEDHARRLQMLADAGTLLANSLDWRTTLTAAARVALSGFAEWCVVDLLDEHGHVKRLSVQHADPAKSALAAEYAAHAPDPARPSGVWLALRTGRSQLVGRVPETPPAGDPGTFALAKRLGYSSFVIAPLVARDHVLGALTFVRGPKQGSFDDADLAFAEELARRAAQALDNARLHQATRDAEQESRRSAERLRWLAEGSRLFAEAHLDLRQVVDAVARHAAMALRAMVVVQLSNPATPGRVAPVAAAGISAEALASGFPGLQESVLSSPEKPWPELPPVAVGPTRHDGCPLESWCNRIAPGPERVLAGVLMRKGGPFGCICARRRPGEPAFTSDDQQLLDDLASRAALSIENARLYHQATEAVSVRDAFLSVAGHELKTPLTALQLQLRCLKREAEGGTVAERLRKVTRQCDRLSILVDELLDVSRITAGRLHLEREWVDLAALAREQVRTLREDFDRADCDVRLFAREPVQGRWDRSRLEQVLSNLLINAIKYGGGKPVDISVDKVGDRARIEVRDQGIGIAPEDQARIFARFERAVSSRHFGGLGLGLWITRIVVEAHGGTITVTSSPGNGATFRVELPFSGNSEPLASD